ncbi:DUF2117 domain-containing protein [Methanocaldococcus indicus]|uniref:DUF2117 domain-containing protein n=1 Tax=Methanocaldococcus indicus TaxID=213231 RepID=UPI003C6D4A9E
MKIGVVVHGPKIVDSGYALKIINLLKKFGDVRAKLGGTMGRVAVIDNKLDNIIDISEKLYPSEALKKLSNDCDVLFLLNYGKSKITGHTFGKIVVERANINKPIIQIERPGENDGSILLWNFDNSNTKLNEIVKYLSEELNLKIERCISDGLTFWKEKNKKFRRIHGVEKGEPIVVNGVVIGRADNDEVILIEEDGNISIIGGTLKEEGLERLGKIDLEKAVIKTGLLRRDNKDLISYPKKDFGRVGYINHFGEDALKYKDYLAVITIGDDTTEIVGDILARFNVRVVGVVDGDKDNLLSKSNITIGSVIFKIINCRDDEAGELLKIFNEKEYYFDELIFEIENLFQRNNILYKKIIK